VPTTGAPGAALAAAQTRAKEAEDALAALRVSAAAATAAAAKRIEDLVSMRDALTGELTARTEAASGRVGQLQRALASAANHAAAEEARWEAQRNALRADAAAEIRRLREEVAEARVQASAVAADRASAAMSSLPEAERKRLTLEMDVRMAMMAKDLADASRKLAATDKERRRLAEENAALQARAGGVLSLLGVDASVLACAPAAALDDVVNQGHALGALLASHVAGVVDDIASGAGYATLEAASIAATLKMRAALGDTDSTTLPLPRQRHD
jgi:hypothetical protein